MKNNKRQRRPTSPGEILSEEYLIPLVITQKTFANHIGVDIKVVNRLINNKTSVNPELALKLAAALNTTPEFWLNAQLAVDLFEVSQKELDLPTLIIKKAI
ncbi:MAG: HigA family addiction module antidote protein [Oligoflexia bacterium]|nr:HigA family addiction module antidote protein [Oligoflexia bacterium]